MIPRDVLPGVAALGHLSAQGWWHPGAERDCQQCNPPRQQKGKAR